MRIAICECECELWMWVRIWVRIEPQQLLLLLERDRAQFGAAFQVLLSLYRFWPPPLLFFLSLSLLWSPSSASSSRSAQMTHFSRQFDTQVRCAADSQLACGITTCLHREKWSVGGSIPHAPLHYDLYENEGGSLSRFSPNWKLSVPLHVSLSLCF